MLGVTASTETAALNTVDEGHAKGWRPRADGKAGQLTFGTVLYDGHLRIIDPEVFRRTLERGLGSAKAYGFGLLSVGRTDGAEANLMRDLHILPKVRDSWSYLYVERARIEQDDKAIAVHDETGRVPVPCASLTVLMLGPGTTITHAAIRTLAECGCSVLWVGEQAVRLYAQGMGETRSARNLLRQAQLCNDPSARLRVVERMYRIRFTEQIGPTLSLRQIRGKEGIRVRETYARLSRETGVAWAGRSYKRGVWESADPINRAVSAANSCLYGVCHAAIVSAGYSPALGFVHTGKMLSFVYDIADLYKMELTVPIAFRAVQASTEHLERRVRKASREAFHHGRLLQRIVTDIERVLFGSPESESTEPVDSDLALPGSLWDPDDAVAGGVNYADDNEEH